MRDNGFHLFKIRVTPKVTPIQSALHQNNKSAIKQKRAFVSVKRGAHSTIAQVADSLLSAPNSINPNTGKQISHVAYKSEQYQQSNNKREDVHGYWFDYIK